jgi:hypothetical protein
MTNKNKIDETEITNQLNEGKLLVVNPRRKNGLILIKKYYAELAGPGAVVGSCFDQDLKSVIAVDDLSLIKPQTPEEKQKAYLIRRQWVRLIQQFTNNPIPEERAQVILNQFEHWFGPKTTLSLPDEAFALLVGVLPSTVKKVRNLATII